MIRSCGVLETAGGGVVAIEEGIPGRGLAAQAGLEQFRLRWIVRG
jgi:hypothetical protein